MAVGRAVLDHVIVNTDGVVLNGGRVLRVQELRVDWKYLSLKWLQNGSLVLFNQVSDGVDHLRHHLIFVFLGVKNFRVVIAIIAQFSLHNISTHAHAQLHNCRFKNKTTANTNKLKVVGIRTLAA